MARPPHGTGTNPASSTDARLKRLRWRCRRGTRELDALLGGWLEAHAASMDEARFAVFDALLDRQDPELWDWLMGHAEAPRPEWRAIVAGIRERAGLAP
jgi:antitoxin CptB